jgi:hypothetical protein
MVETQMVDDQFWLQYAADHVKAAVEARDTAANKIDTYLVAIWAIYTGVFTAGVAFRLISTDFSIIIIMVLPVAIIPIARFLCLSVQLPPLVEFHENIPADIEKKLYREVVVEKSCRLSIARAAALISALSIVASILAYDLTDRTKAFRVAAKYNGETRNFQVYGFSEPNKDLSVSAAGIGDTAKTNWTYLDGIMEKSGADGSFSFIIPGDKIKANIKVFITWSDKDQHPVTIKN